MMFQLLLLFFLGIFSSFFLIYIFSKLFYKLNLLDNPVKYNKKRLPIPYSMGVVFFIGFLILSYFFIDHNYKLYLLWLFGGIITLVSFIDDRLNISPKIRLLMQIIIGATIGLTAIKVGYVSNIFGGIIDLDTFFIELFQYKIYIVSLIFTIIWYVFIFNSLNWTDGIQGNTSGLSFISFFVLFLLGLKLYFTDEYVGGVENAKFILSLTTLLMAILLPFFYFDYKEKILMGDAGTMFLGFMLASLAIISGGKVATVLVVFGMYAIDAIYVISTRLKNKKNPLQGDFTHLHHRLLQLGLSKNQVLVFLFSFSFLFGVSSLFLEKEGKIILFIGMIFFVIFSPKILAKFLSHEKK
ncbi:MAG: glycosyltransferase family 4 protein [Candidatus Altimarinota bacterium]